MRPVDEIIDRPVAPSSPATGRSQVVTELPPPKLPSPHPDRPAPFTPWLPSATPLTPKPTGSVAVQQESNPLTAAQMFHAATLAAGKATLQSAPKQRGRKLLMVLGVLVVVTGALAVVFRDSTVVERFTGKGYDNNPLPAHSMAMPEIGGAEFTWSTQSVAITDGLPTNYWTNERDQVNFTTKSATLTFEDAKASIIGGSIGTPQSEGPPDQVMLDQQSTYRPGATASDPWIKSPNDPGWQTEEVFSRNEVHMFQDVFDPALRAQHPTSIVDEVRHDVPVTTYAYTFAFGQFYESAPRLFDLVHQLDGNAAPDASVTVTVSLDDTWMVRYLDVDVDYDSVLEHRATKDVGVRYPYRYTFDIVSTATAPTITLPVNVVDETTTTTIAPAAPVTADTTVVAP